MRNLPLALLTTLLVTACSAAPDGQAPFEQHTAKAVATRPEGAAGIQSVSYVGTGCPANSTGTSISDDQQVVTSIFSAFVASADPVTAPEEATKNCLMIFDIDVPAGTQYALESVDYRGFAGLERGVKASRQSIYMISGSPVHVTPRVDWQGALDEDYTQPDIGPENPGVWSPCGGGQVLYLATQTQVDKKGQGNRGGQLTVDTIDTELQWRRCQ